MDRVDGMCKDCIGKVLGESKASEDTEDEKFEDVDDVLRQLKRESKASEVCPECNSSKVHINRDKGDSRFGQGKYACNNCGNTFGGESKASEDYEVDVDEYEKTGEPVEKLPIDKRNYDVEAGSEDHVCAECGFVTSDNSEYIDHLHAHEVNHG
jgi:predicted RNA-binding Zn-ribbon protein involved in translation (DUF1610 family)